MFVSPSLACSERDGTLSGATKQYGSQPRSRWSRMSAASSACAMPWRRNSGTTSSMPMLPSEWMPRKPASRPSAVKWPHSAPASARPRMRIEIIDSHCYSLGYGYPVIEAAKKLIAGQSVDNVVAYLTDMFNNCEIYIIGFNLRHMKKSGRINAAAAFLGELMGLKPLISLIDGESEVVKKSRGEKNAITDAVQYISGRAVPETPWEILRTSVTALEDEFIKQYSAKVGRPPEMQSIAGAAVASNTGPYIIGVIIRGNARR